MNSRIRNGILIAVGGFFLIALGIIVAIRILNIDLIGGVTRSEATPAPEMTTTIAFAVNDIVAGTVLSAEDVTMTDIPIEYAPRDAITSPYCSENGCYLHESL